MFGDSSFPVGARESCVKLTAVAAAAVLVLGACKVDWTTAEHTGTMVPVTAAGPGADRFTGVHPNTYDYDVVTELWGEQ